MGMAAGRAPPMLKGRTRSSVAATILVPFRFWFVARSCHSSTRMRPSTCTRSRIAPCGCRPMYVQVLHHGVICRKAHARALQHLRATKAGCTTSGKQFHRTCRCTCTCLPGLYSLGVLAIIQFKQSKGTTLSSIS